MAMFNTNVVRIEFCFCFLVLLINFSFSTTKLGRQHIRRSGLEDKKPEQRMHSSWRLREGSLTFFANFVWWVLGGCKEGVSYFHFLSHCKSQAIFLTQPLLPHSLCASFQIISLTVLQMSKGNQTNMIVTYFEQFSKLWNDCQKTSLIFLSDYLLNKIFFKHLKRLRLHNFNEGTLINKAA